MYAGRQVCRWNRLPARWWPHSAPSVGRTTALDASGEPVRSTVGGVFSLTGTSTRSAVLIGIRWSRRDLNLARSASLAGSTPLSACSTNSLCSHHSKAGCSWVEFVRKRPRRDLNPVQTVRACGLTFVQPFQAATAGVQIPMKSLFDSPRSRSETSSLLVELKSKKRPRRDLNPRHNRDRVV